MRKVSILPADSYVVINKSLLNDTDRRTLTMLYEPLIGAIGLSLYFTLWAQLNRNEIMSNEYTHHHLIDCMGLKLDDIIASRKRLEAVGLLKTLFKMGDVNNYVYILFSPLSPSEFFSNPILSSSLLSIVGKKEYQQLLNYNKLPRINVSEFEDITVHFNDVYTMTFENDYVKDIKSKDKLEIIIDDVLDFDFISSSMPKGVKEFNGATRKLLNRLAYLYNFDNDTMINLIKDSLNEKGMISESELKNNCKNYYSFENNGNPKLIYKKVNKEETNIKNAKNIREKLIECFECTTPYDFLKAKYGGAKPTNRDISLIESLLVDQELNPGVVNVLVDYVLRINDKKLNKNFVEAIASEWKIKKISNVIDAMNEAEKQYKKMNELKEKTKTKAKVEDVKLPSWYGKSIKKKEITKEEQEELESLLSEFE